MNSDTFSFYCDLDREYPAERRAALTVSNDGEHIVFNFSQGAGDTGREVYLRPADAVNVGHLVLMLAGPQATPRRTPGPIGQATRLAGVVVLCSVLLGVAGELISRLSG